LRQLVASICKRAGQLFAAKISGAAVAQYLAGPAIDEMDLGAGQALDRFEVLALAIARTVGERRLDLKPGPWALEDDQLRHAVIFAN
jgi:hypothetical protein